MDLRHKDTLAMVIKNRPLRSETNLARYNRVTQKIAEARNSAMILNLILGAASNNGDSEHG